jgi:hypothetical protein
MVIVKSQTFTTERELNEFIMQKMSDPAKKDPFFKVHHITPVPITLATGLGVEKNITTQIYYVLECEVSDTSL